MAVVEELIRKEVDGSISFGNYNLDKKSKVDEYLSSLTGNNWGA